MKAIVLGTTVILAQLGCSEVMASELSISDAFLELYNSTANTDGFAAGKYIRVGADVFPNGAEGTTGLGNTTNTSTGAAFSTAIKANGSTVDPDYFVRSIADNPDLYGPWKLTFTNGADSASKIVSALPTGATQAPFIHSITISGASSNPTFSWTPPAGTTPSYYRINIYDKNIITASGIPDNVLSANISNVTTSFTVPTALAGGLKLDPTHTYTVEIDLQKTRDGSTTNHSNSDIAETSKVYADFKPLASGSPVVNLPVTIATGTYKYNITVLSGVTYYLDPSLANGYQFKTGTGDPDFASVVLPDLQPTYDLAFIYDGKSYNQVVADGVQFFFPDGGVSQFDVDGITSFDPSNPPSFVTGVSFVADGTFTGTQSALLSAVPIPSSAPLFAGGLVAFGAMGYGFRRKKAAAI